MAGQGNKDALLEVSQGLQLEDDLDLAASGDVGGLNSVLTVPRDRSGLGSECLG